MCNLYKMRRPAAEVARTFGVESAAGLNFAEEVYPGYPGMVVAEAQARTMVWGFPLVLTGKQGQKLKPKPVNNAREDKLHTPFWRDSFKQRRCLVPVSAWAEAEGAKGRMTRTWYGLPDADTTDSGLLAVAGVWRPTAEWGQAYSMVMVDSCAQMAEAHDRMPVLLAPQDWPRWLAGSPEDAFALCRPWSGPLRIDRTAEPWAAARRPAGAPGGSLLL